MTQRGRRIALLDACVLYPAPVRDLLLHIADKELFVPKWSDEIHSEWVRNLLRNRPDLTVDQLRTIVAAMQQAFPDANVVGYQHLLHHLSLPDPDDVHVLAAAIHSHADVIVTNNLRDFPLDYLNRFNLDVKHPDHFVSEFIDSDPLAALDAFRSQVFYLKNPSKSELEVLEILRKLGLANVSDGLFKLL